MISNVSDFIDEFIGVEVREKSSDVTFLIYKNFKLRSRILYESGTLLILLIHLQRVFSTSFKLNQREFMSDITESLMSVIT